MGVLTIFLNKIANKYVDYWSENEITNPKVSVIVPAYNVEKYIEDCLASLVKQTFKDFEVIIINDGSTDLTPEIANVFQHCDKRFRLISQKNQGLSCARNTGLSVANGEYISFVDSDDWLDANFIEKLYNSITHNDCDIAISSILRERPRMQKYRVHYNEEKVYETLQEKLDICNIPKCCYVWNKLYRADLIKNSFFQVGKYFEDVLWIPEVIKASKKLVTVPNTNYYYRVTKYSIVKKNSPQKQNDSYLSKKYIVKFFDENNLNLPKKNRIITKEIKYFFGIPVLKIKEYENIEKSYLFGFFKIFEKQGSIERSICKFCGIKVTIRKNKKSENENEVLNLPYENGDFLVPKVINRQQTLDELINTNKSICRFGDGEFNLIFGASIPFQTYNTILAKKLERILKSSNDNIMIAIPNIFDCLNEYNNIAKNFWRKFLVSQRKNIYSKLDFKKNYYAADLTRPYIDVADKSQADQYFKKFKQVWTDKDVIFIEGEGTRLGLNNDLFASTKSIRRILCPAKNAFERFGDIMNECKKQPKDSLFIIALGPTATVLAYELSQIGYRALDLGHIDIEYEWFLMKTDKKVPIKNKYVNEVKDGRKISVIKNKQYKKEVIINLTEKE